MHDPGESGTGMENPVNDNHFDGEQGSRGHRGGHGVPFDWMPGRGRERRRAIMMVHGHRFGFGGRGGRRGHRGDWSGFGGRGRRQEQDGRGRGRHGRKCRRCVVDDANDEHVTSMAEQMDDDVEERQPHDGEVLETEGKTTEQAQQETTKSNATELEKEKASSQQTCNHGKHGCKNGRGHHKHHHGKHKHHRHSAPHHSMIPPPIPPHLLGFNSPPFPPMHHSHHRFSDCHGNRHMAKKFLKSSMKQWYKAQKRARKRNQLGCHRRRVQRSDEDEATCECDKDDDFALPETRCQLPSPWPFFTYSHHGCGHGRRGFCRHRKKGKKHDKRLRSCNGERPQPALDTTATKTHEDAVNDVEKVHEVHAESKGDQATMEEAAE